MLQKISFTAFLITIALALNTAAFAQEKPMQMKDSAKTQMKMKGMKDNKLDATSPTDTNIVRKGVIDLNAIDKNGDGKIFQCPMELNVISDAKGECPLCGMNLREISVQDAKTKLLKRGFKVMDTGMKQNSKSDDKNNQTSVITWNKVCPVSGEDVDSEAPTVEYKGKIIGFCCPSCNKKFKKDPEKYIKNLSDDGTKFIGTK
jgi:YHS domain-containing protein